MVFGSTPREEEPRREKRNSPITLYGNRNWDASATSVLSTRNVARYDQKIVVFVGNIGSFVFKAETRPETVAAF